MGRQGLGRDILIGGAGVRFLLCLGAVAVTRGSLSECMRRGECRPRQSSCKASFFRCTSTDQLGGGSNDGSGQVRSGGHILVDSDDVSQGDAPAVPAYSIQ